jgi:hypothetical protein
MSYSINFDQNIINDANDNTEWFTLNDKWNKNYIDIETTIKNTYDHNEKHVEKIIIEDNQDDINENTINDDINIEEIISKSIYNFKVSIVRNDKILIEMINDLNILINYIHYIGYNRTLIKKKLTIFRLMNDIIVYFIEILNIPKLLKKTTNTLSTSSYKFCSKGQNCNLQYPDDLDNKLYCNFYHYHFNLLQSDIEKIINYLNTKNLNSKLNTISDLFTNDIDEINYLKCIQTLKYVINTINREFNSVILYYKVPITYILRPSRKINRYNKK